MTKYTIKGYITAEPISYGKYKGKLQVDFRVHKPNPEYEPSRVIVREHSLDVEVPDNFDWRPGTIANLEKEKERIRAEAAGKVMRIDDWIGRLLALENSVDA